jgi:CysZ protein
MTEKPASSIAPASSRLPVGIIVGATYPLRALLLLQRTPQLWGNVLVPILVNLVLGAILYVSILLPGWRAIDAWTGNLGTWATQWLASLPHWATYLLGWLPWVATVTDEVLQGVLAVALLILFGLLLVQFGAILGAPWYGNLTEQIEHLRLGQLPVATPSLGRALQDIWRAIAFQLKKLVLMVAIAIPLFLLNFVPLPFVMQGISGMGWLLLAATLVGLDFLDAPLERRRLSFRTKVGLFGRNLPASASFSLVCLGLVSIPLLNLLAVPLCVAAGTLFCCDRVLPQLSSTTNDQ